MKEITIIIRIPQEIILYLNVSDFMSSARYQARARKANTEAGWY